MTSNRAASYAEACDAATTRQGLDPVLARLRSDGVEVESHQTGGFCMVAVAIVADGVVCITKDGLDETRPYLVGHYPGNTWHDGDAPDEVEDFYSFDQTLDQVSAYVAERC